MKKGRSALLSERGRGSERLLGISLLGYARVLLASKEREYGGEREEGLSVLLCKERGVEIAYDSIALEKFTSHASLTPASTPFPADPLHRHHCSSAMVGCCFTAIGAQQCAAMKGGASAAMLTSGGDNLGPSQLVQDRCWWLGKWKGVGESQGEGEEG
ncbi:unnamed protein product [Closterium sp. NIES-65]|nr:unnamed protein product [Closterium sp. NIES-65]